MSDPRGRTDRVIDAISRGAGASPIVTDLSTAPTGGPSGAVTDDADDMVIRTNVPLAITGFVRDLAAITEDYQLFQAQAGAGIVGMGRCLQEAKDGLEHGQWLAWLESIDCSPRQAQRLMRVARECVGNAAPVSHLGLSKALKILELPPDEREAFMAETHVVDGVEKRVEDMTRAELDRAVRERDEARRALDEAREEQGRIAGERDQAREAEQAAVEQIGLFQARIRELEERPVDVAVEQVRDEDAIREAAEQAAKDTEKRVRDELDAKVRAARTDAQEARGEFRAVSDERDAATARILKLEQERETQSRELAAVTARAEAAERERDAAKRAGASEDRVLYMILAKRIQSDADELSKIRDRARRSGDADLAVAVGRALSALAEKLAMAAREEGAVPMDAISMDGAETDRAGEIGKERNDG